MLRGGLTEGSTTSLLGPPGVGKTSLALKFLEGGLRRGERCLYLGFYEAQRTRAVGAADDEPGGHDGGEDDNAARLGDELARRWIRGIQLRERRVDRPIDVLPLLGEGVVWRLGRGRAPGDRPQGESGGA